MSNVANDIYTAVGRRKKSVARVHVKPGTGKIYVNKKTIDDYFGATTSWPSHALEPLALLNQQHTFDMIINVNGGGVSGQSGAVSLAVARVLDKFAAKNGSLGKLQEGEEGEGGESSGSGDDILGVDDWRSKLKKQGLLTRDSRVVLRKKVGLVKARKAKQFSKR